ncbi:UNVERIFIED_ORG: hypothetical protein M2402_002358 [Rahnella aquatilis]
MNRLRKSSALFSCFSVSMLNRLQPPANVGLAAAGAILPHGYAVELPDISLLAVSETVSLWD